MITPSAPAFYILRASGEAAELITCAFSPGVMGDINDVLVVSKDFTNDIEPMNELDESLRTIQSGLGAPLQQSVTFNPLFVPMAIEELDDVLETEGKSENMRFSGMNGNPFAIRSVTVGDEDDPVIFATVSYQQFDLPSYDVIIEKQTKSLLN